MNEAVITAALCIIGGIGLVALVLAERATEQHRDGCR